MATMRFNTTKRRLRPIKCVFKFMGRPAVIAWCMTMEEVVQAFNAARGSGIYVA